MGASIITGGVSLEKSPYMKLKIQGKTVNRSKEGRL